MVLTGSSALMDEERLQNIIETTLAFCKLHKPLFCYHEFSRDEYEQSARRGLYCLMWLVNKPDRLVWLKTVRPLLTSSEFTTLFKEAWTEIETPSCSGIPAATLIKWFKEADKQVLMNPDEYAVYSKLPDMVTAYRGCLLLNLNNGLSWSLSEKTADFFYERTCMVKMDGIPAALCEAHIPKSQILAYFNDRGENELIVNARYVWKQHDQAVNGAAGTEVKFLKMQNPSGS